MTQISSKLSERADSLAEVMAKPPRICVHIGGEVGLGKTTFLHALAKRLPSRGLEPILISPPLRAVDSGVAVIAQIADHLQQKGMLNGDADVLAQPRVRLDEKLDALRKAVEVPGKRIVLLCDEPAQWLGTAGSEESDDDVFVQERKLRVLEAIAGWNCRTVFAGALPKMSYPKKPMEHQLPFDAVKFNEQSFGNLSSTAADLDDRLGAQLQVTNSLSRRLLVGYAKASSTGAAVALGETYPDVWLIARKLLESLSGKPRLTFLRDLWLGLALFRRPLPRPFIEEVGARALDEDGKAILYDTLLQDVGDEYVLHDVLKRVAAFHHSEPPLAVDAHTRFAEFFRNRLQSDETSNPLTERVEGFHHAALAGLADTREWFPEMFVEQLHVLGRTRSKIYGDHAGAAQIFAKAVDIDPDDDYSHHYWAYNLDCDAADEETSEREYREALKLNEAHPWWWSRWINFLITTGRLAEARREWNKAHVALGVPDCGSQDRVWRALHLWVARLLLHRGQTDFARFVLSEVPEETCRRDAQFIALGRLLRFVEEVESGDSVFPWSVAPEQWWLTPPLHLGLTLERGRFHLHDWSPARVMEVDERNVWLTAAKRPVGATQRPVYGTLPVPVALFDAASPEVKSAELQPDQYLVLAIYRDGDEEEIRVACHSPEAEMDRDLPGFDPRDPRRYLKRSRIQRVAS